MKSTPALLYFGLALIIMASCSVLTDIENSINAATNESKKTSTKSATKSNDWWFTAEEKADIDATSKISSLAYQKLLMKAIEDRNIAEVKKYISLGANPNAGKDEYDNLTMVVRAVKLGCWDCLDAMGSKVDINHPHIHYGNLPLVKTCVSSLAKCKKLVMDYDADPNAFGKVAINYSKKNNVLRGVIYAKDPSVIPYLISVGAKPSEGYESAWYSYMIPRSGTKNPDIVNAFLEAGTNPDITYSGSICTALTTAIDEKRTEVARVLLKHGANPSLAPTAHNLSHTPLYFAIEHNNFNMVKLLIDHGVDCNVIAYERGKPSTKYTALNMALSDEDTDQRIIDLLISKGAR